MSEPVVPPRWTVTVAGAPGSFRCPEGASVLVAMAGTGRSPIDVGCRSGGCGVCRVMVRSGTYTRGRMSAAEVSDEDRLAGVVLACRIFPTSDLELLPLGRKPWDERGGVNQIAETA